MKSPVGDDAPPDNPYQAPGIPYEPTIEVATKHPWLLPTVFLQTFAVMIGVSLAWVSIESIIFTGALFAPTGLLVTACALRCGNQIGIIYGLSAPLLSLAVFILINYNGWSPHGAYWPVNSILSAYGFLALSIAIPLTLQNPK